MIVIKTSTVGSQPGTFRQRWPSVFEFVQSENQSGWQTNWGEHIERLNRSDFFVLPSFVDGDAPKNLIKAINKNERTTRRKCRRTGSKFVRFPNRSTSRLWPAWLAKGACKWYPNESIVEHLLSRLGQVLGMPMAETKLVLVGTQIRLLSRYFLKPGENLMHGAQIYAAWLSDESFVKKVEREKAESTFFPFQEAEKAIRGTFEEEAEPLLEALVRLLAFDALVGNSDRHFYNWAVITDIMGEKTQPRFAPVYDTARGLLWNYSENKLVSHTQTTADRTRFIGKYARKSCPKMGWQGMAGITHFEFFKKLCLEDGRFNLICTRLLKPENLDRMLDVLDREFRPLFSPLRFELMQDCLQFRFDTLLSIINHRET